MTERVVVDTQIWSAVTREVAGISTERGRLWQPVLQDCEVVISFATYTEALYGAYKAGWSGRLLSQLEQDLSQVETIWCAEELADIHARIRSTCRAFGHGLHNQKHEADRWIGATAMFLGVALASDDGIFRNVPGLALIRP